MTRYTRVTLVGSRRRVDAVLPSDEPVGRLLPEVMQLTAEPPRQPPVMRHLATTAGALLDPDATLADVDLADGTVLRLVGLEDAPPPPVIHDVAESVADDLERRTWRWDDRARRWVATAAGAVAAAVGFPLATARLDQDGQLLAVLGIAATLLVVGAVIAKNAQREAGTAMIVAGGAVAVSIIWVHTAGLEFTAGTVAAVAVTTLVLGAATDLGRGGLIGGGVALCLLAGWVVPLAAGLEATRTAAVLAVASVLLLGLLPRLALSSSGLTGLDDRRSRGNEVARTDVEVALTAAHRGLSIATVACAASGATAGWLLGTGTPAAWSMPLAGLLAVILLLRARSYPLTIQVGSLIAATAAVAVGLLVVWLGSDPDADIGAGLATLGVAVLALLMLLVRLPDHTKAQLRRVADRLEAVAVIATVPVTVGLFGLYTDLLNTF